MSEANEQEWQEFLSFYRVWLAEVFPLSWPLEDSRHPLNVLDGIANSEGRSVALRGLRQAVSDIFEMTSGMPRDDVTTVDRHLSSKGIITLSALRQRCGSGYQRILKRGKIRLDEEFHLLKGIADGMSLSVPRAERRQVSVLLRRHEPGTPQILRVRLSVARSTYSVLL